ncbi:MAG TPA: hypothetical protein VHH36_01930 [Candidatus Thermoplasmatota archaeon]|nr:hypothetical protein [Candidatus Thermoplasmatota archaeon]
MDETFFRARYEADRANQAKQPWKEYADWVKSFYEGRRFPPVPGWNDRERDMLKGLAEADRARLAPLVSEVGRALAAEWAKDNAVRKVSTSDLQAWGKRFGDARGAAALEAALSEVKAEVAKRTGQ